MNYRLHLNLIKFVGLIVPRRLRADWRQEWEAELRYQEILLAEWDRLNWIHKIDLWKRSLGAFWDALWLQPQRWEDEMIQDLRFALLMLFKHRGLTLTVLLTLAVGIGREPLQNNSTAPDRKPSALTHRSFIGSMVGASGNRNFDSA